MFLVEGIGRAEVVVCSNLDLHGVRAVLDRDYSAEVNIMVAAGLVETLNACGGSIRLTLA